MQLAAQLNISRTPLREALRRLQSEGLLEGDFNRRLRVAPLSVDDLEQVAAMRIMLESFGVEASVPKLDNERLDRAAEALRQMDRTLSDRNRMTRSMCLTGYFTRHCLALWVHVCVHNSRSCGTMLNVIELTTANRPVTHWHWPALLMMSTPPS
ncbi:hypothetical protein MALGJ_45940 [Mycolicibacter algericus]|uniref:HTH gntR-type domain-containing protein n=1 Tax=Mycolicibacter algericus TaxID=1288388 RepID=A0A7I9YGX3_MYCAL|nr:hypothetical protein MALGJ_45940 [Mycolicibacter algericus]